MPFSKLKTFIAISCFWWMICSCNKELSWSDSSTRYKEKVFSSVEKTTISYDIQPDFTGNPTVLLADIYQPSGDHASSRAAIIYVHGGSFIEGARDGDNQDYFCESLAKKGYVVASIDYRLGFSDPSSITQFGKAQIRAVQDLKSFIRFVKQNASSTRIDTTKIFTCGSSAGGVAALAAAFLDYSERPAYIDTTGVGGFEGKGNLNGHSTQTKAVYSMWGAVTDTSWIKAGDIPVGAIQSINDPCIPWNFLASSCQMPEYGIFGSNAIYKRASNLKIYSTVYGFKSDDHNLGLGFPHIDTTIAKMSEFFLPLTK